MHLEMNKNLEAITTPKLRRRGKGRECCSWNQWLLDRRGRASGKPAEVTEEMANAGVVNLEQGGNPNSIYSTPPSSALDHELAKPN